jgi:hypothetical protein
VDGQPRPRSSVDTQNLLRESVTLLNFPGRFDWGGGGQRRTDELLLNSEMGVGAGDGLRTRYLNLGKVALYRVSYSRVPGIAAILLEPGARSLEDPCT